jgi:Tfp pilus assembly protein PilN
VRIGRKTIRAEAQHRGEVTWAGEAGYESLQDLTDTIARLAAEAGESCRRLAVTLERPPVQTRTLTDLPPVKERELGALVAHQSARFFRKNGHPLVTDALWAANGRGRVAHAAAIEEPIVEAIVAGARAAGLVLEGLAPVDCPAPLMLLPSSERVARARAQRKLLRRLGLATGVVWTIVLGLEVGRLVWERRANDREFASLQAPLAAVLTARRELHDAEATLLAVASVERDRNRSLEALGALAHALPDSAVLTSVTWNTGGYETLTGYARSAADVLARIERISVSRDPRFGGPVVNEAIAGRDWQRFTIVFGDQRAP